MQSHPAETAAVSPNRWLEHCAARLSGLSALITPRHCLYALLYGLVIAGALLRVDYIVQFNPLDHIWSDPQRHWEQGTDTLRSDPMALTDPVLYQLYIGALGKLTLMNPLLVAFYTSLLSLCTPWIWYRFLRELQPGRLVALGGWAALSLLPSWIAIYGYFMQETLLLPLLGAALYASWRCRRKRTLGSFLLMAFLWALAGLTRGIAIPLAAVTCSWLWLEQEDKLRKAVYSALILTLILGPLAVRSYQQMQLLAPHGIGKLVSIYTRSGKQRINISYERDGARWSYWFASPATGERPLAPLSDWTTARRGTAEVHIDLDRGGEDWHRAKLDYPMTVSNYLWITRENLVYLFFGASWPDNNGERALHRANIHMRWIWAPLALLLIAATAIYWRRLGGRRLLPVLLLVWVLVQGLLPIAVNEGRYRKPGEGLLLACSALLLGTLPANARKRREHGGPRNHD
ncbi:glycosyltransferase family 39 protein [Microbulbifer taiwanensis]|uniref:Glycosyltransferase family 39 protein n=1 Tax=Microbulbifer taiwanensis TaxID=986746 RepID=A0ABW1YQQ0_9GAMM|nr:glycosyltransferase family 39 protein [Microbulbifer taiwanensis]